MNECCMYCGYPTQSGCPSDCPSWSVNPILETELQRLTKLRIEKMLKPVTPAEKHAAHRALEQLDLMVPVEQRAW